MSAQTAPSRSVRNCLLWPSPSSTRIASSAQGLAAEVRISPRLHPCLPVQGAVSEVNTYRCHGLPTRQLKSPRWVPVGTGKAGQLFWREPIPGKLRGRPTVGGQFQPLEGYRSFLLSEPNGQQQRTRTLGMWSR